MRPIFQDEALETEFRERGYVKVRLLDAETVEKLASVYRRHEDDEMQGFHTTLMHDSPARRREISDAIIAATKAGTQKFLRNYEALVGNFVVKEPGANSLLPVHQDWSIVSEQEHTALNIWCALQDIEVENGAIRMYPGSHRLPRHPRSPSIPNPYGAAFSQIEGELVTEQVKAGEALIFEGSLIHASFPNLSRQTRLASALIMVPQEAETWHFYLDQKRQVVEKFAIDRNFFDTFSIDQRPRGYSVVEEIPWKGPQFDLKSIHRMISPRKPLFRRLGALLSSRRNT